MQKNRFSPLEKTLQKQTGIQKTAEPTDNLVGKIDGFQFGAPEDYKFIGQN